MFPPGEILEWLQKARASRNKNRSKRRRAKVFERDKGVCAECNKFNPNWEVHHKLSSNNPKRNLLEHLATLCTECHDEVHGEGSKKKKSIPLGNSTSNIYPGGRSFR